MQQSRMESDSEERKENPANTLWAKMAELEKTKEELKRAKDKATQSFIDSKPLIDELERLKAGLASAKNRYSMSNTIVSELESELETTTKSIMSKNEEEAKATRLIKELTEALDETREKSQTLKPAKHEERRARSKLKQVLRLKKQRLRTSHLMLRATRIESKAFEASAAEALRCIRISETDSTVTLQLTQEQYHSLKRRAKEKASLADWRISVSMEQKEVAEASRDFALSKLQEKRLKRRSRMSIKEEKIVGYGETTAARKIADEQNLNIKDDQVQENRGSAFPKVRAKLHNGKSSRGNPQRMRKSKSNYNRNYMAEKRKTSIFLQIKYRIVRSITRLFA